MTETPTKTVQLTDGRTLRLTYAEPENTVRGGLVVLHENPEVDELLAGFAAEGWLTVAPHLFDNETAGNGDQAEDGDSVLVDTDAACVWLAERDITSDRIGVIGFDLGAAVAMAVAAKRSVGAAVSVSGPGIAAPRYGLPPLLDMAGELSCPWLGMYGASDEIPAEDIELLKTAAAGSEMANDVVRFDAEQHRFDSGDETAGVARLRVLNWFDSHLR